MAQFTMSAVPEWTPEERRTSQWAIGVFAGLMISVAFIGMPLIGDLVWAQPFYAIYKAAVLVLAMYVTLVRTPSRATIYILACGVPFLIWNIFSLISAGPTLNGVTSILSELSPWFAIAIGSLILPTNESIRKLLKLCLGCIVLYFVLSIVSYILGARPDEGNRAAFPILYLCGGVGNLDSYCLLASGIIFLLYPRRLSPAYAGIIFAMAVVVVLSASRTYLPGLLFIGGGVYVATRKAKGVFLLLPAVALIGIIGFSTFQKKSTAGEGANEDDILWGVQTDGRLPKWEYLISMTNLHPWLGNGPGFDTALIGVKTDDYAGTEPDNDFIAVSSGVGWPGGAFLLLGMLAPAVYVVGTRRRIPAVLRWTTVSFTAAYLFISLTDNPLRNPGQCYPFFVFTGLALRQSLLTRKNVAAAMAAGPRSQRAEKLVVA